MPVSTLSRLNRPLTPPVSSGVPTPGRANHMYPISSAQTSTTYSPTITAGGQQQKLNVVTRVAVEGRAKVGQDGAAIKMYLKISLPLDSIVAGMTIPLFQEENVKILTSQVHPLDSQSVPYNFSSTLSPLLHNAARALNLPARSSEMFDGAFNLSPPPSHSSVSSGRASARSINGSPSLTSENIPPVDGHYTGHILVSGYNISYVLPKAFPSRNKNVQSETEGESSSRSLFKSRRLSIGERNTAQFMAAIDMWVPYVSRPPRSPYLLSIPTPRCLHNNIKLRIFPPTTTSSSFASLSSIDDDGGTWDLTSDPHVTRTTSARPRRSNSYTHFADDESSDSSATGFTSGCGIQGTFPSAERVRVRWAKPLKTIDIPGGADGRRRVGVQEVKGEMICIVRGKSRVPERPGIEGVVMDVEYKGTCKGVWFPGVATLLGMDVGLETKGSDVHWAERAPDEWEIGGGVGYTGFEVGSSPRHGRQHGLVSRTSSLDSNAPQILNSSSPEGARSTHASRTNSGSSTSSLLRAPLPAQNVLEYSFEGKGANLASSATSPTTTMSSMSSLIPSLSVDPTADPPGIPITLHLNMNEIVAPAKNTFTFTISGTVLIVARPTISRLNTQHAGLSDSDSDPEPIVLPRFTVLAADSESTTTVLRNEIDGSSATVEVYNPTGDIHRDAQARKTVLQPGGFTKCTEDGARIAFKSIGIANGTTTRFPQSPNRARTPNGNANITQFGRAIIASRPKRDGPLMIPSVVATVTPLLQKGGPLVDAYTTRLRFNAPADADSEWLEFGFARSDMTPISPLRESEDALPKMIITSVTVEGVPVRYETTTAISRSERSDTTLSFEKINGQEWVNWVRMHVGSGGGGVVIFEYLVQETRGDKGKGHAKVRNEFLSNILLPTFPIPVGRLEVRIDVSADMDIISVRSNFAYEQSMRAGRQRLLLHFSKANFFYPQLSVAMGQTPPDNSRTGIKLVVLLTWLLLAVGLGFIHHLGNQMEQMKRAFVNHPDVLGSADPVNNTVTTILCDDLHLGTSHSSLTATPAASPEKHAMLFQTASLSFITPIRTDATRPDTASAATLLPVETEATPASASSPMMTESQALLPMHNIISIYWPTQDWRVTLEKVMETVEVVWQIFRKVYHYPLDPP